MKVHTRSDSGVLDGFKLTLNLPYFVIRRCHNPIMDCNTLALYLCLLKKSIQADPFIYPFIHVDL